MATEQETQTRGEEAKSPEPPRPSESDVRSEYEGHGDEGMRREGRRVGFARRHPLMSVLGAAGLGLFGGIEMAAGVLVGAGVYAALRGRAGRGMSREIHEAGPELRQESDDLEESVKEKAEDVTDRARGAADRATPDLVTRARAIVQAARGKIGPVQG